MAVWVLHTVLSRPRAFDVLIGGLVEGDQVGVKASQSHHRPEGEKTHQNLQHSSGSFFNGIHKSWVHRTENHMDDVEGEDVDGK